MSKRSWLALMGAILWIVYVVPPVQAQWVKNGTAVGTATSDQSYPTIISDGAGGAIISWCDSRSGNEDIYAQRIDASGAIQWTTDGAAICTATNNQEGPQIVSDGAGGAIIAWFDFRSGGSWAIYVQRVSATGDVQWTTDGVLLTTEAGVPVVVSDGAGGAIVTWQDWHNGQYDIYAQRVNASGDVQWMENGIAVCAATADQRAPQITSDGAGGAIITWWDSRSASWDIYAQRIDASGAFQWTTDGIVICAAPENQEEALIASDGAGGAIITWTDNRSVSYWEVYAQRVNASGAVQWTADGVALSTAGENQFYSTIVPDGASGAIVTWMTGDAPPDAKLHAQRIDAGGTCLWLPEGVMVFPFPSSGVRMISDGQGGAIIALNGYLDFLESNRSHIYAQRLDPAGNLLWATTRGVGVCTAPLQQFAPELTTDDRDGAIIAWTDVRAENNNDVYCQHVGPEGLWGDPEPAIISSLDLPGDQGGSVRLKARASSHDIQFETDYPIAGYTVWRKIGKSGSAANSAGSGQAGSVGGAAEGGTASAVDRASLLDLFTDPKRPAGIKLSNDQAHILDFPPGEWESVAFLFATRDTVYNIAAPTRDDSTSSGIPWEIYVVTAHTSTAGVFVTSEPDTGYSVDNLAPGMTSGFAGEQSLSPAGLRLTWDKNDAPDLWKYNVHRGNLGTFVPDPSNLIGTTEGTEFLDPTWLSLYHYYYKLVAVDRHGNPSASALLRPEDIKVGTLLQAFAASLKDAVVDISWTLSEAGAGTSFRVLRAEGAGDFGELSGASVERNGLSFTCIDRTCEPGATYRYRVDVEDESGRRPLFETDAISTPVLPLTLYQNHPNPFNPSTVISFYVPEGCQVSLDIYDTSGKLVSRLMDRVQWTKGTHQVEWRGVDAQGKAVSSGVYFYRLMAGKETISRKMILVR